LVQALAMETGCVKWVFQATGPVRAAILAVPLGSAHALLFGDQVGWFYTLDAETGRLLWKKRPEPHESTRLTGAPAACQGTVFVWIGLRRDADRRRGHVTRRHRKTRAASK